MYLDGHISLVLYLLCISSNINGFSFATYFLSNVLFFYLFVYIPSYYPKVSTLFRHLILTMNGIFSVTCRNNEAPIILTANYSDNTATFPSNVIIRNNKLNVSFTLECHKFRITDYEFVSRLRNNRCCVTNKIITCKMKRSKHG